MMRKLPRLAIIALLCSACTLQPDTALTWNVYVGADVTRILTAPTMPELATRVEQAWQTFQASDFPARAAAIADRIAEEMPALVGLQEIALVRVQSPGDRFAGGLSPATHVEIDFEQVLLAALAARGLDYRVVARVQNADIEVPRANATMDDVRITDHDIILARCDVDTRRTFSGSYATRVVVPLPDGASVADVRRGFVAVQATFGGRRIVFANTHLETAAFPVVQQLQAIELLTWLGTRHEPLVVVGDFNSAPDDPTTTAYDLFASSGHVDAWQLGALASDPGYTCCQDEDLRNPVSSLDERIDLVWLRDGALSPIGVDHLEVDAHVIGEEPADRTPTGLWPSDHAGVSVTLSPW